MKVREHSLKKFSANVQMQTCVVFFPHTIKYVMVEKPPEEGAEELDEPSEPVMVEQRVCELAKKCAWKYEELNVVDAKERQLTEETLNDVTEAFNYSLGAAEYYRDNNLFTFTGREYKLLFISLFIRIQALSCFQ